MPQAKIKHLITAIKIAYIFDAKSEFLFICFSSFHS